MTENGDRGAKQKVLIAGGGIAGVEAALALHDLAGDRIEVGLHDPRSEFVFKPFAVGEPYGAARIFHCDLRQLAESCGASFQAAASSPSTRRAGSPLPATATACPTTTSSRRSGVRMLWAVPGAVTFWGVPTKVRSAP